MLNHFTSAASNADLLVFISAIGFDRSFDEARRRVAIGCQPILLGQDRGAGNGNFVLGEIDQILELQIGRHGEQHPRPKQRVLAAFAQRIERVPAPNKRNVLARLPPHHLCKAHGADMSDGARNGIAQPLAL